MNTKMSIQGRNELVAAIRLKYRQSDRKTKNELLNGLIAATGFQRKYAIALLNKISVNTKSGKIRRQGRKATYDKSVQSALIKLWQASNQICAKRLVPFLPELIRVLEHHQHFHVSPEIRHKLLNLSVATTDRLLKSEREAQSTGNGVSTTRPGSLLKKQIQIRTFADWDDVSPGFLEGDLVAHCGDSVEGSFLNTLVLTDIATGWTEFLPLLFKSSQGVVHGIDIILKLLPFPLLGIDTDNGSEFINYDLLNFCKHHEITFTRSRAYKKNDQAHVEEKNGSIVRRIVGYSRYEGIQAWSALVDLYAVLRLYINYFQPSLKLLSKERKGSKVIKKYDEAKTPYQRLLNTSCLTEEKRALLTDEYEKQDPVYLLKELKKAQDKFHQYAWIKATYQPNSDSVPVEVLPGQSEAMMEKNRLIEFNELPKRFDKKINKPRKKVIARHWRTYPDIFENVWDDIRQQLELNPNQNVKSILEKLITRYPDTFQKKHLRTLQRRVAQWRISEINSIKNEHSLKVKKLSHSSDQYLSLVLANNSR